MKNITLTMLFALLNISLSYAQEDEIEEPLEYPFGETGKPVPRGVFGEDDRKEVKDAEGIADFVRATAVMIPKSSISGNRVYGQTLRQRLTRQFGVSNFDSNIRFLDQPTVAHCTGFLIAPDILVTAGHCIERLEDAKNYVWVFDYTSEVNFNEYVGYVEIDPNDVYEVTDVLSAYFQNLSTYTDYSVLKLDRKTSRAPYRFRTSGKVTYQGGVSTIGSPTGLPLKYADNAIVVDNSPEKWFKNNIDGFPGNSGGPVFNPNGFIEGIHVRGAVELQDGRYTGDYKYDYSCNCVKTLQWQTSFGTAGSHAHRITHIPYEMLHKALYENIEYAIMNNMPNRLNSWLAYGWILDHAYTNERGRLEFTAAYYNNTDALSALLSRTETVVKDSYGRTLLFHAIDNKNMDMLMMLLDKGLSPNEIDDSGTTPIFHAMKNRNYGALYALLDNGGNVYSKDRNGNNLLHLAARNGNLSLISELLRLGADASAENYYGDRPEDIAKRYKYRSARKILKKARKRRR